MFRTRLLSLVGALCCLLSLAGGVAAAEVEAGSVYCFSLEDFSEEESVAGICITELPQNGAVMLGSRVLRAGDVLTAGQLAEVTFSPAPSEADSAATLGYLPIYKNRVAPAAAMTIGIRGKEDQAPVAEDSAAETYKNLPVTGRLKVNDPEGTAMTFTVTRQPRRGTVTISPDGSFTYTPRKNKVGIDSFTFTAADAAGKISREATVTVTILRPKDAAQYSDTTGCDCRFAAEWMRQTGIFAGEQVAESSCFSPDKAVTRGEFVTMLVKALDIPADEDLVYTGYTDKIPGWLQPYLAAAMRAGLTAGLPDAQVFEPDRPITGADAGVMLQNALDLTVQAELEETTSAFAALTALGENGIQLDADEVLTRGQAAVALYEAAKLNGYTPIVF